MPSTNCFLAASGSMGPAPLPDSILSKSQTMWMEVKLIAPYFSAFGLISGFSLKATLAKPPPVPIDWRILAEAAAACSGSAHVVTLRPAVG